jgi:transcriptional regulator with XRE-family HTH domain
MPRFDHELLRAVRLDLGLGQEEAAAALGVDARTFRRYESGAVNDGGDFGVRNASRRRLLRRMSEEFGVDEAAWIVPDPGSPPPRPAGHALQRAPRFVGRAAELAALARWADAPDPGVLTVLGLGGAGKTALVERFVASRAAGSCRVHSFYDDPRTEAVVAALAGAPAGAAPIVVLDGVEVMQSAGDDGRAFGELVDPTLRRALRSAAAGAAGRKVLLTSRLPPTDLAAWEGGGSITLRLPALSADESAALLRAWGLAGDDRALAPLAEGAAGHALSLAMVGSYASAFLGCDPALAAGLLPSEIAGDDPLARRLTAVLAAYAARLTDDERELLARLSLFAGAADRALLATLGGGDERAVLRGAARLERLGLVARTPAGVTAHPFVRGHFKSLLRVDPAAAHATLRDAATPSLAGDAATRVGDAALLDRYERVVEHTRRAGLAREAWGVYLRALGGFDNLGLRVGAMTLGARVLAGFADRAAPERVDASLGAEARAALLYDWALYAGALGDLALARRCHDAHLAALAPVHPDVAAAHRAMGLRTRAYVEWVAGDTAAAAGWLDDSMAIGGGGFHVARGAALRAMVAHDAGDADGATRWLAVADRAEPAPSPRRALWLAELRLDAGDAAGARAMAEATIATCARRGWAGHVAHGETLAGLAWAAGDAPRAEACLERARPWARRSGEVEVALRCHALAAAVARARGRDDDAGREVALGVGLARAHGFGRFERRLGDHVRLWRRM